MTDIALPGLPVADAPEKGADNPAPPAETQAPPSRNRRRKLAVLLFLLVTAFVLTLFAIWYLLFRTPITEVIPDLNLTNPPGFQLAIYGVNKPLGIAVSPDGGRLYVTQGAGDRTTLILDAAGTRVGQLAPPTDVVARATQLYVAINPRNGNVYASDRTAGAVYRYGADGSYLGKLDAAGIGAWQPLAIAFDATGNFYVADVGAATPRIHVFDANDALVRDIGVTDGLTFPNGIGIDAKGNVYVADTNNGRLVVFDATGARVGLVGRGSGDADLGLPRGVAIDGRGRIYVVDAVGQQVQMYRVLGDKDIAPTYLTSFGREGTVDGTFEFPNGVAADGRGRVYVADWNNDRVQTWSY
jgi:DNA-binding beta-propeller fold protein YncE